VNSPLLTSAEPVIMKLGMHIMVPQLISSAYFINLFHQSMCLYRYQSVSLLGNGSVGTLPWQRMHATIEELLEVLFSIRSVSYEEEVYGSVCVTPCRC
jgi:hypothetical protein